MRMAGIIFHNTDFRAIITLLLLWLLFFWRLFTPIVSDQASLATGDFSGQFVAFGGYQYQRMSQGQIPLWNPYNNGGLPFIADTQAAVFYPPRWLTIGLSSLSGGWSYNALQLEMTFHVLLYTLFMYVFVRRLTLGDARSPLAGLAAAIIIGYGGYTTGYPPLQLAVLEAAVWLPLTALGILEATRGRQLAARFILLAGFSLGMSWLAGHPQTSWFLTYVAVAYLACRCFGSSRGLAALPWQFGTSDRRDYWCHSGHAISGHRILAAYISRGIGFRGKRQWFPLQRHCAACLPRIGQPMVATLCRPTRTLLRRCRRRSQPARGPLLVDPGDHWLAAQLGRK